MFLCADTTAQGRPPSPSVGGGLPLLLLSVLPPVIPQASWPSAGHGNLPTRHQVTFSSESKLNDSMTKQTAEQSKRKQEYYIICDGHNSDTEASGKPASALRFHMNYLTGLVPSSNIAAMTSSCNTSFAALNQHGLNGASSSKELHPLKRFCGRAGGGGGPIISVTSNNEPEDSTCLDVEYESSTN